MHDRCDPSVASTGTLELRGIAADHRQIPATLTALTFDGGDDADTLRGGNGADLLLGNRYEWNPGDGNDIVDGESGTDLLDFGSSIGETIEATTSPAPISRQIQTLDGTTTSRSARM
jgi:hypothetical protein